MATKCITVWPEREHWIVSLDCVEDDGGAATTHTLEVMAQREEAIASARKIAAQRSLPAYEQTGRYAFSRPL